MIWLPLEAVLHRAEAQLAKVLKTESLDCHREQKVRGDESMCEILL